MEPKKPSPLQSFLAWFGFSEPSAGIASNAVSRPASPKLPLEKPLVFQAEPKSVSKAVASPKPAPAPRDSAAESRVQTPEHKPKPLAQARPATSGKPPSLSRLPRVSLTPLLSLFKPKPKPIDWGKTLAPEAKAPRPKPAAPTASRAIRAAAKPEPISTREPEKTEPPTQPTPQPRMQTRTQPAPPPATVPEPPSTAQTPAKPLPGEDTKPQHVETEPKPTQSFLQRFLGKLPAVRTRSPKSLRDIDWDLFTEGPFSVEYPNWKRVTLTDPNIRLAVSSKPFAIEISVEDMGNQTFKQYFGKVAEAIQSQLGGRILEKKLLPHAAYLEFLRIADNRLIRYQAKCVEVNGKCFTVSVNGPQDAFLDAETVFQRVLDSLTLYEAGRKHPVSFEEADALNEAEDPARRQLLEAERKLVEAELRQQLQANPPSRAARFPASQPSKKSTTASNLLVRESIGLPEKLHEESAAIRKLERRLHPPKPKTHGRSRRGRR